MKGPDLLALVRFIPEEITGSGMAEADVKWTDALGHRHTVRVEATEAIEAVEAVIDGVDEAEVRKNWNDQFVLVAYTLK